MNLILHSGSRFFQSETPVELGDVDTSFEEDNLNSFIDGLLGNVVGKAAIYGDSIRHFVFQLLIMYQ